MILAVWIQHQTVLAQWWGCIPGASVFKTPIFPHILLHKRSQAATSSDWPECKKQAVDWLTSGLLRLTNTREHTLITGLQTLRWIISQPRLSPPHISPEFHKYWTSNHMWQREPSPSGADHWHIPQLSSHPGPRRETLAVTQTVSHACPALTVSRRLCLSAAAHSRCRRREAPWKESSGWHQGSWVEMIYSRHGQTTAQVPCEAH